MDRRLGDDCAFALFSGHCVVGGVVVAGGDFPHFQQAEIVKAMSNDPNKRTAIFAQIDLAVSLLTLIAQFLATGKLIKRFGVGPAAAFLPLVFALGFVALWATPMLWVVIAFQAVQRAANFAISNPARTPAAKTPRPAPHQTV